MKGEQLRVRPLQSLLLLLLLLLPIAAKRRCRRRCCCCWVRPPSLLLLHWVSAWTILSPQDRVVLGEGQLSVE
jgi:hypothetical protein